ncbi:MAG: division/cell wall cluster transcriptional repressor MraZ [Chitinophagales bacterium]|nr:division/cell wall cluster transcriptional repressor MraZ [Chitinophagales bacterium]MDW8274420.1 division/cell wall cluster transcriptional repressor MraZ [Chitinophagales bacterium]
MNTFRGQFNCTIDDKGRIKMPVSFKAQFPPEDKGVFMLKKGLDDCLEIYPLATWQKEEEKLRKLDRYNPVHRAFYSTYIIGLTEITLDSADRFLIPKSLMGYINNAKEVVLKGELDCIQIWDVNTFNEYVANNLAKMYQHSIEVSNYLNELEKRK